MTTNIPLPAADEYAPFYADYIQRAHAKKDVIATLSTQIDDVWVALSSLDNTRARFKPGPADWSIKEVMGHLNDVERVFSYRLLRISRNDSTPLPGFDQEEYVRESGFDNCSLADLIQEFDFLRRANILSISHMSDAAMDRRGTASGAAVSARALVYMLVGHVEHHMASLREKYLPALK